MLRLNGGLSYDSCRVKGLPAHTFAALALAVAHNLRLQLTDPLAAKSTDSDDDDDSGTDDDSDDEGGDFPASGGSPSNGSGGDNPLRAPP